MQNICKKLGFQITTEADQRTCVAQFVF
jgi:hypothetical protein